MRVRSGKTSHFSDGVFITRDVDHKAPSGCERPTGIEPRRAEADDASQWQPCPRSSGHERVACRRGRPRSVAPRSRIVVNPIARRRAVSTAAES